MDVIGSAGQSTRVLTGPTWTEAGRLSNIADRCDAQAQGVGAHLQARIKYSACVFI